MGTGATSVGHVDAADLLPRRRLLDRLDGPEQLCVIHAEGGSGKTVLLSQWVSRSDDPTLWLDLRAQLPSRTGFWLRVLAQLHADGWIDDATLSREVIGISESAEAIGNAIRRVFHEHGSPRVIVIDGLPDDSERWTAVVDDLVALLQERPDMRCLVTCASGAVRDTLLAEDVPVSWVELTTNDLALSRDEARQIMARDAPNLRDDRRDDILESDAARRPDRLRFAIEHLDTARSTASTDSPRALMESFADDGLRDFVGITALAPMIDADLARVLTARPDAGRVLDRLVRQGAGGWIPQAAGDPLFRYRDGVRQAASADLLTENPRLVSSAKRAISRWLAERLHDYPAALIYALEARDYDRASALVLRAWPFDHEDNPRLRRLVRSLPVAQIHRRPVLALWYGLLLNEDPATQNRAAPFFVSAAALSRARNRSMSPSERAILRGFESLIWRLVGQSARMADSARQCIDLVEAATTDPDYDTSMSEMIGTVLHQACVSLCSAGATAEARDGFGALVALADRFGMRHRRNLGLAGMAFVDATSGNVVDAARTLDRIREEDWPEPWRTGYAGALERLARAWVGLSTGSPRTTLAELGVLDPHFDTIEFWDLISIARVLAESRRGHARSATHIFMQTARARLARTSLPIVRDRINGAEAVMRILTGTDPAAARESTGRTQRSTVFAMRAISAGAHGDSAAASVLLRKAETTALTPQQDVVAVAAGAVCASRLSWDEELRYFAGRLSDLTTAPGTRWPLILISDADRVRLVAALESSGQWVVADSLRAVFDEIEPVATDRTWRALAKPTLTPREDAVLRALFTHESRADLADALFVSVNTVKTQLRSLYAKLGVSTREQALARAVALGIPESGHETVDDE